MQKTATWVKYTIAPTDSSQDLPSESNMAGLLQMFVNAEQTFAENTLCMVKTMACKIVLLRWIQSV